MALAPFEERVYRVHCRGHGLVSFTARVKETDLLIRAERDLAQEAVESILRHRRGLETYLEQVPQAADSLVPLPEDPLAPLLVRRMLRAGRLAGTGPMAAVAGAIAEAVGRDLLAHSGRVVVENGGDLFLASDQDLTVGIWAGGSPLSGRLGLKVPAADLPLGLATSSGTVGHSLSLGKADAAVVLSPDAALADAAATALGNRVRSRKELASALEWVSGVEGVTGALVVLGDRLAAWGDVNLVELAAW